jgi:hypothetical protein
MNPAKLLEKKAPQKGREKETKGKDQSPGKQTAQKRRVPHEGKEPLSIQTSTSRMKHIN